MTVWNVKMNNEASLWHLTIEVARKNIFFYSDFIIYFLATGIFINLNDILNNVLVDSP